jgi:hypothetical protein
MTPERHDETKAEGICLNLVKLCRTESCVSPSLAKQVTVTTRELRALARASRFCSEEAATYDLKN